ncbi:MAG TPA: triose-phosphate isomerase [Gammaproteobacteria bacterium]|nr:triose-phosphate isomerase [Gammaproteobacteria bacterium]
MSRQKLIMGNWKMNGDKATLHALIQHIKAIKPTPKSEVVVFPPYVYLEKAVWELRNSEIQLGAQDVSQYDNGAYTGEISGSMLTDIGCKYVLIGHSERRHVMGETDEMIGHKVIKAFQAGLKPVLCVGETQEEHLAHRTEQIVLAQLESVLNLRAVADYLPQMIVAYEPVWAIGTGLTATPLEAQKVHLMLREALGEKNKALAEHVPIVYGGSVKASNAKHLFEMPDIDGALIGGASLNGEEFHAICRMVEF